MLIAPIEQPFIRLEDFKEVWQRTIKPVHNLITVEGRIFGRTSSGSETEIYEILPDGGIELRFSVDDIIDAVLAVPGLRTRLEKRIEESAARFGEPDLDNARQAVLGTFVQSPDISQQRLYDVDLIAFSVRLDLLRSESMVLFLQPVGMSLRVIGYCHIPDRILEVYQIVTDSDGTPRLIGTVMPTGEPFDLLVRYRGVETSQGILFTPDGSLLRHEIDIVRIAMFTKNHGFVCDDHGAAFKISFDSVTVSPMELELQTRPRLFDLVAF